ncbi:MAG: nucleotide sugar dehydrogenase [Pseudomonadota bacterium]
MAKFDVLVVGGLGHIGLPLGLVFADTGLQVALYDINEEYRRIVAQGRMPFEEDGADELLEAHLNDTLHVAPDISSIADAKTIFITIGTPLDGYLNPRIEPLLRLAEEMKPHMRDGQLVILRSTVTPGTTDLLNEVFREAADVHVAFCPERVVQGKMIEEMESLPQIISGCDEQALSGARRLFERLQVQQIETKPKEAEFAKLFCNAWRYITFAAANQFYMLAETDGLDFDRIQHAMTHDYARMQDFPSPGFAAGPCLMKDTMQLAAYARRSFELGQAAMFINEGLASFAVDRLSERLGGSLVGRRIAILGMAFKAGSDDIRDSLSYKIRKLLVGRGAVVRCSDDYVEMDPTLIPMEEALSWAEGVIVGTPHKEYRGLAIPPSVESVDVWNTVARA